MPVSFTIHPHRNLVHIRYEGEARLDDSFAAFAAYAAHPDASRDQRHLVDLSAVTDVEEDFPKLMALQAEKADKLSGGATPAMLVYLAPTPVAQRMAQMIRRSWEGIDGGPIVATIADEAEALKLLGCPERSTVDLSRRLTDK